MKTELEMVIDGLEQLKDRLRWLLLQKDIFGYGYYVGYVCRARDLLKAQQAKIDELQAMLDAVTQRRMRDGAFD